MTFYGLMALPDVIFLILLFVSYRSLFVLRRELSYQLYLSSAAKVYPNAENQESNDDSNENDETEEPQDEQEEENEDED